MAKKNASARSNTKGTTNSPKKEEVKEEGTLMKGARKVTDVIGGAASEVSKMTLTYGIGGVAFFAIASYFGLGLIGTLLVAAAVWAVIEIGYILFSKQNKYQQKRDDLNNVGESIKNLLPQKQAA